MNNRRTRRGKRSDYATQRREAARIVSQHALRDLQVKETINLLTPPELAYALSNVLGTYDPEVAASFERGEVLSNAYAEGSLQRLDYLIHG
jgi:hypothetical protein